MNMHKNARLTPHGREVLVRRIIEDGLRPEEAAQASGVSVRTAYKWLARFRTQGPAGLMDRSSRPRSSPNQTTPLGRQLIVKLRRQRWPYRRIALALGISQSTVGRVLQSEGLNRLSALDPAKPANRYEYANAGGLLHLDIKKLGRFRRPGHRATGNRRQDSPGVGWEYVHVAIDDHSRVAFTTLHADETGLSACKALLAALRYYRGFGIQIRRVLTDNGTCYKSKRFAKLCRRLGIRHLRTKPYTPRTNGKAERFIQTALREWAYAQSYDSSAHRAAHLPVWLHQYNWHRPHAALDYNPPISRLNILMNNLMGLHS